MLDIYNEHPNTVAISSVIGREACTAWSFDYFTRDLYELVATCEVPLMAPYGVISSDSTIHKTRLQGYHPRLSVPHDMRDHAGIRRLSGLFTRAVALFSGDWDFGQPPGFNAEENPVYHLNIRGAVVENADESHVYPDGILQDSDTFYSSYSYPTPSRPEYFNVYSSSYTLPTIHEGDLKDRLDWMQSNVGYASYYYKGHPQTGWYYYWIPAMKYTLLPDGRFAVIYARHRCTIKQANGKYNHDLNLIHHMRAVTPDGFPDWNTVTDLTECYTGGIYAVSTTWSWSSTVYAPYVIWPGSYYEAAFNAAKFSFSTTEVWGQEPSTDAVADLLTFERLPSTGRTKTLVGYNDTRGVYEATSNVGFLDFRHTVRPILLDAYPLCFLSSKDAVDAHLENQGLNQFEALADLETLFGLVDAVKLVRAIHRMDWTAIQKSRALREILGILSKANLVYSFALAPTVEDSMAIASAAKEIRRKFFDGDIFKPHTIYGKHYSEVPSELSGCFSGMGVTTRSKLRLSLHPDSLLSVILPLNSLGLLPTLSTVWETIPWSFAIDWAYNLGKSLELVDALALFQYFELEESVHSVLFHYTMDGSFFEENGLTYAPVGSEEPNGIQYRLYTRYLMDTMPSLSPSRLLTEELSSRIPDWSIAGSLVYQISFG